MEAVTSCSVFTYFNDLVNRVAPQGQLTERDRLLFFPDAGNRTRADEIISVFNELLLPHIRRIDIPIPKDAIKNLRRNYTEKLGKVILNGSLMLNNSRSGGYNAARQIGLVEFLQSSNLKQWAERITGFSLYARPSMQVLCYEPGDYVSPHNDHHPEQEHLKDGYIDIHFMFSNSAVESQFLYYEKDYHMNQGVPISLPCSIAVYYLPFWHYTTPMTARQGQEKEAMRWVVLASYAIKRR